MTDRAALNTDRELWREREGDYYANSIHVTEQGGIGISVGSSVIVKPLAEWHALAKPSSDRMTVRAPNAEQLVALAERCEQAMGPVRELDELISAAVEGAVREVQAGYTASVDAALTLVPEWCKWGIGSPQDRFSYATMGGLERAVRAATPALAITAAALRAHAQAIEAQRAETAKTGSVEDESAVGNADVPKGCGPKEVA